MASDERLEYFAARLDRALGVGEMHEDRWAADLRAAAAELRRLREENEGLRRFLREIKEKSGNGE